MMHMFACQGIKIELNINLFKHACKSIAITWSSKENHYLSKHTCYKVVAKVGNQLLQKEFRMFYVNNHRVNLKQCVTSNLAYFIDTWVPQGSILNPHLFLIVIDNCVGVCIIFLNKRGKKCFHYFEQRKP